MRFVNDEGVVGDFAVVSISQRTSSGPLGRRKTGKHQVGFTPNHAFATSGVSPAVTAKSYKWPTHMTKDAIKAAIHRELD
jgi:hypothetical protein